MRGHLAGSPLDKMSVFIGIMRLIYLALLASAHTWAAECDLSGLSVLKIQERFRELDRKAQVEFRHLQFSQALEDFRQATCVAPDEMRPYYALFGIASDAAAKGDFVRAREALQEADRLRPGYPLPLAMLIKVSLIAGDNKGLRRSLLDCARRFPHDYKLHAEMAQDLLHEKQNDLALAESLRAEEGSASNAKAVLNLAVLESQAAAFGDAARLASSLEEQDGLPESVRASAAAIAGLSYEGSGQLQQAAWHLKMAIRLDPKQEQPYLALSRIYVANEDRAASVEILEEARAQLGSSPRILLALGSALVSTEQNQAACQVLTGLIENFPDQLEAYPKLADAYRKTGEPSRATEALQRLAVRKPDYPMIHTVIAQSMLDEEKVDYARVLRELADAEKRSPEDYDVYYLRGRVFLATGEFERAVSSLQRAIELRPNEPSAYYQLGLAYSKIGKPQLAKEQFDRLEFLRVNLALVPPGTENQRTK